MSGRTYRVIYRVSSKKEHHPHWQRRWFVILGSALARARRLEALGYDVVVEKAALGDLEPVAIPPEVEVVEGWWCR